VIDRHVAALLGLLLLDGCRGSPDREPAQATTEGWLVGDTDTRFALVEGQLRGLDVTMVEVGHRYRELHAAMDDGNWPYAEYQLDKIATALANGVERRPKRAQSARLFEAPLAAAREAARSADAARFQTALVNLTAACNACHEMERVPFMRIVPPSIRTSTVTKPPASSAGPASVDPPAPKDTP
jgi:cytochrome c553